MNRFVVSVAATLIAASVLAPSRADAFCGFYVSPGDQPLLADATQVVLMRKGTRTVLSMQNNYKGPPSDFAMVIPVPVVLQEPDVKTLPKAVFTKVESMGAPRLVEYWEQDPCYVEPDYEEERMLPSSAPMAERAMKSADADDLGVTVEAKFAVGEYQIVILGARDSTGLDTWLRRERYNIPKGAEPLLRPYVESGMKFFVAKVDIKKVKFGSDGRADLSPLRFHYDAEQFVLPIRLGLANSSGTQDLIVNILAPDQRYEVANYKNATIPTNLDVKPDVKNNFAAFYAALFDRTVEKNPGAVITEYAWQASTCDPCPGPNLDYNDFTLLGADVLDGDAQIASDGDDSWGPRARPRSRRRPSRSSGDFVLTRLHARYGTELRDDLVFKEAPPIVGGREHVVGDNNKLEEGARPDEVNNFQGRYAIRYPWTGPIACANPRRGIWGGPPGGGAPSTRPALELAFAPRGGVQLAASIVPTEVPELAITGGKLLTLPKVDNPMGGGSHGMPVTSRGARGCGCRTGQPAGLVWIAALGLLLLRRRRA